MNWMRRVGTVAVTGMVVLGAIGWVPVRALAQTPIPELVARLEASGGKERPAGGEISVKGVVGARHVLPDGKVLVLVLNPGETALKVWAEGAAATELAPRHEVTLSGSPSAGPVGAGLALKAGSVSVLATNKPFGASEGRDAAWMKDASSLAGRYVQLTNVTFVEAKLGDDGLARVKAADGAEAVLRVSKSAAGRAAPVGAVDVFGFPVRVGDGWQLVAARVLQADRRDLVALATKHTCITCHNPEMKLVGPAYRDVAARYRDDAEAAGKLMSQMRTGGSGKWGAIPMLPFEGKVSPEDMKRLADWILGYRWDAILAE
ncbi:MAG: hypothetical protein IT580_23390 [Verrucomicrobiales bacterium]|nr:hypothetical protein [Verrucomicrobiales bacterium]